ncbi:MAG: polyprenyl diphosphate synthase [bacterium]
MSQADIDLPRHVAIIMDGNGRWATRQNLPRAEGHNRGADAVRTVTRACRRMGVKALTLYAFSEQNWNRPVDEVQKLMSLLQKYLIQERAEIMDNAIRLTTIGRTDQLPRSVRDPLDALIRDSAGNQGMALCLALSYGGREELVAAMARMAQKAVDGELDPASIDEDTLAAHLWSAHLPPLDLLIRTSGEQRISNFMLWHLAYAELYFTPTLWPDFGEDDLRAAFDAYRERERRFGRTGDQVEAFLQAND